MYIHIYMHLFVHACFYLVISVANAYVHTYIHTYVYQHTHPHTDKQLMMPYRTCLCMAQHLKSQVSSERVRGTGRLVYGFRLRVRHV